MSIDWLEPDWPAPIGVRAISTLRTGGVSQHEFSSLNLGEHVGDDADHVRENRRRLIHALGLANPPRWLNQVHGTCIIDASKRDSDSTGDGAWADVVDIPCVVMTADCLPVLLCAPDGRRVAAVHAGWRGLAAGVIEAAVARFHPSPPMAWLGPAIGPEAFEVGDDVRLTFLNRWATCAGAFRLGKGDRWLADIYVLARKALSSSGVDQIYGGTYCTHSDAQRFFSYRRDGRTGRMATLIWRQSI